MDIERRIFQRRFGDLSVGIREEISVFVTKLYSKDMISVDVKDRALNTTVDKGQRASELLSALESRIRTDSNAFVAIVRILESIPALSHLAQSLQADYQHMKEVNVKPMELEKRLLNDQLRSAQIQIPPPPSRLETSKGTQQPFTSVLSDQPDTVSSSEPASATVEGQSESVLPQLRKLPGRSCTDPQFLLPPIPQSSESEQQLRRKFDQDFASVHELLMELIKLIQQKSDEVIELKDQIKQLKLSQSVHDAEKSHLRQQLHSAEEQVKGLTAMICRLEKIMSQKDQELSDTKEVHDAEKSHLRRQLHSAEEHAKGLTATICRLDEIMSQKGQELSDTKEVHNAEKSHLRQQLHSEEERVKGLTATICRLDKIMSQKEQELSDIKEELTEMKTKLENTVEELKVKLSGADKRRGKSRSWPLSGSITVL